MSSGTVKELRKAGKEVLFQVVITVLKNGDVQVSGFPSNVRSATKLVSDFNAAMWTYFVQEASKGNIDSKGFVKKSNLILPKGMNVIPIPEKKQ